MISIVLGLGIANMFGTIGILIRNKEKVVHSITFYLHCTFITLLMFQGWWTVFGYKDYTNWNFFFYLLILILISLIYLMTEMLKVNENLEVIDLDKIFLKNKTLFLIIFIVSVFCGAIIQSIVTDSSIFTKVNILRGLIVLFSLWGVFSNSLRVQKLVAFALLFLFAIVIVVYRLNLGELSQ